MQRLTDNKIVLITRPTRLAELVARFNTVSQARFYIEHQGADFTDYWQEDQSYHRSLAATQALIAQFGRLQTIDRSFLPNFLFAPEDTVVTLGQDGLVANTLKYLNGQPVIALNPDPERWDGKLLPFQVKDLSKILPEVLVGKRPTRQVTMAQATLNNQQVLYAVNDLFIGPKTHGSARYVIHMGDRQETQSSSGVIVSTGMGSTGWLKSVLTGTSAIMQSAVTFLSYRPEDVSSETFSRRRTRSLATPPSLIREIAWNENYLVYAVREPFPTKTTGASLVFGRVTPSAPLILESRMPENGVIFSDGLEKDFLEFNSGTRVTIGIAERKGNLVA